MPLNKGSDKDKDSGFKCGGFGQIGTWKISGYDEGSPLIWLSTKVADYYCVKPASGYKKHYDLLFEKARACIEVYKTLSKCNSDCSLEELFAGLARSFSGSKFFFGSSSIKAFVLLHGEFIYKQLICLEESSMKNVKISAQLLPVLTALRDECIKHGYHEKSKPAASSATLMFASDIRVGGNEQETTCSSIVKAEEDEDTKLARVVQDYSKKKNTLSL